MAKYCPKCRFVQHGKHEQAPYQGIDGLECLKRQNVKLRKALRYAIKTLQEEFGTYCRVKADAVKAIKAIMKGKSNG